MRQKQRTFISTHVMTLGLATLYWECRYSIGSGECPSPRRHVMKRTDYALTLEPTPEPVKNQRSQHLKAHASLTNYSSEKPAEVFTAELLAPSLPSRFHARMRTPEMTTCLWFTGQAEEAAAFYLSIFKDGKTLGTSYYGEDAAQQNSYAPGSVLAIWFEIIGRRFIAMNATPNVEFNTAVSFIIECETQAEIDYYWDHLTADGGEGIQCGWLKDKFGVTWQVTPAILSRMMCDPDPAKVSASCPPSAPWSNSTSPRSRKRIAESEQRKVALFLRNKEARELPANPT